MRFGLDLSINALISRGAVVKSRFAAFALWCFLFFAMIGLATALACAEQGVIDLRKAARPSAARGVPVRASSAGSAAWGESADFVADLPAVSVDDQQILFATKLANEQSVHVQQIQSEALKTDSKHLVQHRLTLQLRGDYRDIKNIWIALLGKFPGLTLEHLTIRHHAGGAATSLPLGSALPPADRGDDEATIEMIQYLAPAKGES